MCFIMRPSSLGGGRILCRTLSVCLSVRPVLVYIRTSVTCFRQPCGRAVSFVLFTCQGRAAYSTAISAAQACCMVMLEAFSWQLVSSTYMVFVYINHERKQTPTYFSNTISKAMKRKVFIQHSMVTQSKNLVIKLTNN